MKILIATGIYPPDIGGPATQLDALAKELIKKNFQVQVLTFGENIDADYPYSVKKISNHWPPLIKSFIYFINAFLISLKADILYNQDLYTAGKTSLIIKKILRKKLVTRFVGDSAWEKSVSEGLVKDDLLGFQKKKYGWRVELRKKIRKKILLNSDKIITVSNFLKQVTCEIGIEENKIEVVYNSVDFLKIDKNKSKSELKDGLNIGEGPVILTIARLVPWKGVDMLVQIMPQLTKKHPKARLFIIGEGPDRKKIKRLISNLNLKRQVFLLGKAGREQTINYLQIADVFVLNTNYEGMSHTLLESMKIGVPTVTTFAGGNPETIKNNQTGLLVPYNDSQKWIEAIDQILSDSYLAKHLAEQARKESYKFNWDNLVEKTVKVFESLYV